MQAPASTALITPSLPMEMELNAIPAPTVSNAMPFQATVLSAMPDSNLPERIATPALPVPSHQDRSVINAQDAHSAAQSTEIVPVASLDSAYPELPVSHAVAGLSPREEVGPALLAIVFARHAIIPMDSVQLVTQVQE